MNEKTTCFVKYDRFRLGNYSKLHGGDTCVTTQRAFRRALGDRLSRYPCCDNDQGPDTKEGAVSWCVETSGDAADIELAIRAGMALKEYIVQQSA